MQVSSSNLRCPAQAIHPQTNGSWGPWTYAWTASQLALLATLADEHTQRWIDADRSTLQRSSAVIAELVSGEQKSSTAKVPRTIEISDEETEPSARNSKQVLAESPKRRSKKLAAETPPKRVRRASSLSRALDARINGTPPWKLFSQTAADMDAIEEAMLLE